MILIRLSVLLLTAAVTLVAAEPTFTLDLKLVDGGGDKPMIVIWAEKADGTFLRTLHMYSKDKKYFKDMTTWTTARGAKEDAKAVDAVVGPTIAWGKSGEAVKIPAKDLLAGNIVLRIEQRKDKGGSYTKRKIAVTPDWPGVTLEKDGYIQSLIIKVER